MPLSPRARLGAYEITGILGAGAMGEVYLARDTRLGREVALKILPAEFADSADRRRRFEQEARAASALNHPNIVAIYDVGNEGGVSYIVSELVDGESLRDSIRADRLGSRRALELAAQIADGLAAAHAAGIVHRDLKPENVMLARDGRVKILDFGLARYQPAGVPEGTVTITQPGLVMGTAGYMSPEQVSGTSADARSDIFSLGTMLHEMLAGKLPFDRGTAVETMSAILRDDPADLPVTVPPAVARIVAHCLEKEPARRFQSAQDLAFDLRALSSAGSMTGAAPPLTGKPRLRMLPLVTVALGLIAAAAIALLVTGPRSGPDLAAYRFTPFATESGPQTDPVWSPDGKNIAYVVDVAGAPNHVMVRSLDSLVPTLVAKADATSLNWSPDGTRLYFSNKGGIWSVSRAGGEQELVLKGDFAAAALSPDGKALVVWVTNDASGKAIPKIQISSPPGAALKNYEPVLFQSQGSFTPVYLRFSPDGRNLLLSAPQTSGTEIWLLRFPGGAAARGKPKRLFQTPLAGLNAAYVSWMPDSRRVVLSFASPTHPHHQLWMGDTVTDRIEAITADEGFKMSPSVSPDGKKIAYSANVFNYDIVEIPASGGLVRPLVATSRDELFPAWSPVGSRLAYVTNRSGRMEIWLKEGRDGWERPLVTQRDFPDDETSSFITLSFSPDGSRLAYARNSAKHIGTIWISPVTGGSPIRLTNTDDVELGPTWSPDGNWITYQSTRAGVMKVRVGSSEPPVSVRNESCHNAPQWSPDGQWIACSGARGVLLLSPDGKSTRTVGDRLVVVTWSRDGKLLYVLGQLNGKMRFGAIDVRIGAERVIYDYPSEVGFSTPFNPGFPMSLSSDGQSIATSVLNSKSDIWILEGFER